MAPFWFWKPALYWNYNETLQCAQVILRKLLMTFVSLATEEKSWPVQHNREMCAWSSLPGCHAQGPSSNTKNALLRWRGLFSLTETLSRHSPCHSCSPPGKPAEFPAPGATPAAPLSLLWSKGTPSSAGLSASLQNHGAVSLLAIYFSKMHLCQYDWVSFPAR